LIAIAKSEAMVKGKTGDRPRFRPRLPGTWKPWSVPGFALRGGRDVWENVVTACDTCNHVKKRDRTPEESGMPLAYLPYAPCRYEHFILSGRDILADQMAYLLAKVSRTSRILVE